MTNSTESKYKDKFIAGVDFGDAVTGLALGKNGVVTPVKSVESKDSMTVVKEVIRLVKENKVSGVVLGLPLSYDHKETPQSAEVRRFAKMLKTRLGIPVMFVDEFGTTREATAEAIGEELPQKARRRVDSISAAIILKRFFSDEGLA